ncbi:hypothetical protein LINPERHAP1_LOCUS3371 [Linum perenne]
MGGGRRETATEFSCVNLVFSSAFLREASNRPYFNLTKKLESIVEMILARVKTIQFQLQAPAKEASELIITYIDDWLTWILDDVAPPRRLMDGKLDLSS